MSFLSFLWSTSLCWYSPCGLVYLSSTTCLLLPSLFPILNQTLLFNSTPTIIHLLFFPIPNPNSFLTTQTCFHLNCPLHSCIPTKTTINSHHPKKASRNEMPLNFKKQKHKNKNTKSKRRIEPFFVRSRERKYEEEEEEKEYLFICIYQKYAYREVRLEIERFANRNWNTIRSFCEQWEGVVLFMPIIVVFVFLVLFAFFFMT